MNLKEAFRYQNFLNNIMDHAANSVMSPQHCTATTKTHFKNKVNPDAQEVTEEVRVDDFYPNDDVIRLMEQLIEEKDHLTKAISQAKNSIELDLDAAIETNKFRQKLNSAIKNMLLYKSKTYNEQGRDYRFNVEGNQTPYFYDVEVEVKEAFNRDESKAVMRDVITASDKVSAEIDAALINTQVNYEPPYDVNDTFEDVMETFIAAE